MPEQATPNSVDISNRHACATSHRSTQGHQHLVPLISGAAPRRHRVMHELAVKSNPSLPSYSTTTNRSSRSMLDMLGSLVAQLLRAFLAKSSSHPSCSGSVSRWTFAGTSTSSSPLLHASSAALNHAAASSEPAPLIFVDETSATGSRNRHLVLKPFTSTFVMVTPRQWSFNEDALGARTHTDARPLKVRSATFTFRAHLIATQSASQAVGCAMLVACALPATRCSSGAWTKHGGDGGGARFPRGQHAAMGLKECAAAYHARRVPRWCARARLGRVN